MAEDPLAGLMVKFKQGTITDEEKDDLFELLDERKEEPDFKIKTFCKAQGFSDADYERLLRAAKKAGRATEPKGVIGKMLERAERRDMKDFAERLWADIKSIGEDFVMKSRQRATEKGMSVKDYLIKAEEFYWTQGDRVDELENENRQLAGLAEVLVEIAKPAFVEVAKQKSEAELIATLVQLKASGLPITLDDLHQVAAQVRGELGRTYRENEFLRDIARFYIQKIKKE